MARHTEGAWYRAAKDTWYAIVGGRKVSLGVKGKENRKAAQEAWHKLMVDGPKPKAEPKNEPTIKDVTEAFLADVEGRAKLKTAEVYRYLFREFVAKFGGRMADSLKPHEVEAFARKPNWSASTRNGFLGALVSAFRWAVRAGMISTNPLVGIRKPPKASRGAKAVITATEFKKLHAAASAAFQSFLMGLWLTGCRPGELARLKVEDVDFNSGLAVLTEHKTSHHDGKPRLIFLSPEAAKLFRQQVQKRTTGALFLNTFGGAWNEDSIGGAMTTTRKRAGLAPRPEGRAAVVFQKVFDLDPSSHRTRVTGTAQVISGSR